MIRGRPCANGWRHDNAHCTNGPADRSEAIEATGTGDAGTMVRWTTHPLAVSRGTIRRCRTRRSWHGVSPGFRPTPASETCSRRRGSRPTPVLAAATQRSPSGARARSARSVVGKTTGRTSTTAPLFVAGPTGRSVSTRLAGSTWHRAARHSRINRRARRPLRDGVSHGLRPVPLRVSLTHRNDSFSYSLGRSDGSGTVRQTSMPSSMAEDGDVEAAFGQPGVALGLDLEC
jgi:hypothetical protein